MQDDDGVRQMLEAEAGDQSAEYTKKLALLLQRRQQARQAVPAAKDVMPVPTTAPPAKPAEQQGRVIPRQSFALVVASYTFRNLPPLSEKTKDVATALFNSLVDQHFNRFSRRGSKLLLNPSVIEFQDAAKELQKICAEKPDSSFFMCLITHGARVTRGSNEGSYVLFSETRLSSEEELILTAVHERELAEMIHGIACKNKFVVLELCQTQEPKEKLVDYAVTIRHRIHDQFLSHLHKQLVQLRVQELLDKGVHLPGNVAITRETVQTNPKLLNLILVESCDVKTEVPVRANEENVSNFLLRLRDAFRSGAGVSSLDDDSDYQQGPRPSLFAKEVLAYICSAVRSDAVKHNDIVHAEYTSQVRTKYERAAEFQAITHTPGVLGAEYAVDFGLGETPEPPTVSPTPPTFVNATLNSISLAWEFTLPNRNCELPAVLGYHIQRRGHGRACVDGAGEASAWKRVAAFQVLSYEQAVRESAVPPTTITAYGLNPDTAYCFRVRACTAGGWGPFSEATQGYRTLSVTSTQGQFETLRVAALREGARGVVQLMNKHDSVGGVQRVAVELLAKMATEDSAGKKLAAGLAPSSELPTVVTVRNAMQTFKKDTQLQQQGCLLFGRLAASSASWQTALRSVADPSIVELMRDIMTRCGSDHNRELMNSATWALAQVQGAPIVSRSRSRPTLSPHDAATRLQTLYRCRKARESMRMQAQAVYSRAVDPTTGTTYFYNSRTGASFWALPAFVS